jgi:3-oxoacyl-[acyl-carrier-protein] synthase III
MIKSQFESIGVYLPEKIVSTEELIARMENKPQFDLVNLTGIKNRRWRSESEDSYTLAVAAAKKCLEKSKYKAKDIDIIICSSITRYKGGLYYFLEPPFSKFFKDALGLRKSAMNFDMTNACAGMLTSVHILNNMIKTGAIRTGMIVSGESITPIAETAVKEIKDPIDMQFASLTVGDSGAAVIMDASADENEGIDFIEFLTIAEFADLCFGMPSAENPGPAMYTKALEIHKEVLQRVPKLGELLRDKYGTSYKSFDYLIPHQTSTRAIKSAFRLLEEPFGGACPEMLISVDKYGNTSSTSHFVVLDDYLRDKRLKKDSRILFCALASGIVIGILIVKIGALEDKYGYNN